MSYGNQGPDISFKASADLSAKQFYAVVQDADGTVNLAGASEKVIGILQNQPESGKQAVVRVYGVSQLVVSEVITPGKLLTATSTGKGEVVDAASEFFFCMAMGTSTADGDRISVLLGFGDAHASDA